MFIRVNKTPNSPRKSIQICETYRKEGKVKQRIVHYVGIALDEREEQKLKDYAQELIVKITAQRSEQAAQSSLFPFKEEEVISSVRAKKGRPKRKNIEDVLPPSQVHLDDVVEESRIIEGVHEVGGCVFDDLYGDLLSNNKRQYELMKDVVLSRLVSPSSKHRAQQQLEKRFGKPHSLDRIYRMMDKIYPKIDDIKRLTFSKTQALFPESIDLLLFDVTTLYFESTEVDELRNFGYSKDHRFNTTRVVLALATNQEGLPVGYELFEGNRAEVTTLIAAIKSWRELFNIDSVCFVGDRAMFTKENMALLEKHDCHYIIAAKLKNLPKETKEQLLSEAYYRPTVLNHHFSWIGDFDYEGKRLIVSYKTKRALKDRKDREQILKKIEKVIGKKGNPSQLITNTRVKKFITKDKEATITLDEEKIKAASRWDGLHGIITNIADEKAEALIARYARLWVIEESFRVNKHTLKMRPIFHWKPERIHAHIALCYMTFSVLRHLQYQANLTQKISIDTILDELLNVQASIHIHKKTKDRYRVPGYFTNNARKIYKAFGIKRNLDATVYFP
ncbi:MAG: IS1634 family transposase [Gammaproteobacteria bacterium]